MSENAQGPLATGNFEITVALSQQRQMKMAGYTYEGEPAGSLNKRIDAMQDAMDRQLIRVDLVNKRAQIEGHILNLENMKQHYQGLVEKQQKAKKISSQEKNALDNYEPTVRQAQAMILSLRAAIEEGEKKLAAGAS